MGRLCPPPTHPLVVGQPVPPCPHPTGPIVPTSGEGWRCLACTPHPGSPPGLRCSGARGGSHVPGAPCCNHAWGPAPTLGRLLTCSAAGGLPGSPRRVDESPGVLPAPPPRQRQAARGGTQGRLLPREPGAAVAVGWPCMVASPARHPAPVLSAMPCSPCLRLGPMKHRWVAAPRGARLRPPHRLPARLSPRPRLGGRLASPSLARRDEREDTGCPSCSLPRPAAAHGTPARPPAPMPREPPSHRGDRPCAVQGTHVGSQPCAQLEVVLVGREPTSGWGAAMGMGGGPQPLPPEWGPWGAAPSPDSILATLGGGDTPAPASPTRQWGEDPRGGRCRGRGGDTAGAKLGWGRQMGVPGAGGTRGDPDSPLPPCTSPWGSGAEWGN